MNRIVPLILAVALFMEMMDSTVIATSLPAIAADIGTSPIALKLAFTTYLVALAIFIPASGWMADRFGARRVFMSAIGVFMAGSLLCAAANSLEAFVGARFIQGMGGSMMTPLARLVLVRATERSRLVEAMSWLAVPALMGPMVGPVVGGFLTTFVSWHWIFLINIPIGLAGIALSLRYLPVLPGRPDGRLDAKGLALSGLAASGIVFGLSVVSLPALPMRYGLAAVAVGTVCAVAYVRHALTVERPVLDLRLFKITTFRSSIVSLFMVRLGVGATPFLLPLMLQIGFGLSAFNSGLVTFIGAVGALLVKFITTRTYAGFGFKPVLVATTVLSGLFLTVMGFFSPATPFALIYAVLFFSGIIRSLMFTGFNALSFADLDDRQSGAATAIAAAFQQIGLALGVALAGMFVEASIRLHGGGEPGLADFQFAFIAVSIFSLGAVIPMLRLDRQAGSDLSGHGHGAIDRS
ncbi:MAG: MDR family MFS transporter [Pseudomonadota bacterium]|nr:MDR family MFS transporter [Pseudomonadota bacterium]